MKKNQKSHETDFSESLDDNGGDRRTLRGEKPSRLKGLIFFVLCTILVVSTVAYGAVDAWMLALLSIAAGLIVVLWLADSFFEREFYFSANIIQFPLLGLILIGFIQLLPLRSVNVSSDLLSIPPVASLSLDPYGTRLFIVQLCVYLIFFAACLAFLDTEKRRRAMVFTIVIFGSVIAFAGVIQSLTSPNPSSIFGMRESEGALPFATFVNRHHFAAFMNMTIGLTLGLLYGNATKRDKRLLLIISLALMGIALMFTGSRGGFLSLVGVVGFVVLLNLTKGKSGYHPADTENKSVGFQKNFLIIGSALILILLLIGSALFFGGESYVTRGIGLENQGDVSTGRFHFWQTAWQIIRHNPIIGAGLDAFGVAFTRYDTWNGFYRVEQAHNDYLQILADAGILGFLCLLVFIFLLFKKGLQVVRQSDDRFRRGAAVGALAGCFGVLIHSFFDFPLRTPSNALFFLVLTALATIGVNSSKLHQKRSRRQVKAAKHEELTS